MSKNPNTELKKALDICSTWVTDASGEMKKDCISCPYHDPADPMGMDCGEKLMRDALNRIKELEKCSCEMKRIALGGKEECRS